jgi:polyhydroxyalkanoate synthesis regulator phasin
MQAKVERDKTVSDLNAQISLLQSKLAANDPTVMEGRLQALADKLVAQQADTQRATSEVSALRRGLEEEKTNHGRTKEALLQAMVGS